MTNSLTIVAKVFANTYIFLQQNLRRFCNAGIWAVNTIFTLNIRNITLKKKYT